MFGIQYICLDSGKKPEGVSEKDVWPGTEGGAHAILADRPARVGAHEDAAQALAPRIRVMGIAPGLSLRSGEQSGADFAQKHNQTILQRGSTPEDLAHALLYILSAPSMTGTTLMVDGGQHLTASARDVMFLP